jgi:TonB family protein
LRRPLMRVRVLLLTVCSLSALKVSAEEHDKADLKAGPGELQHALALPLSPGSVAMLVDYAGAPEAQERLVAALHDTRAETRAAGARVVNVLGINGLVPELLRALEAERDSDAAREELRALAVLGGPRGDSALYAAASRLRGELIGALTDVLARRWNSGPAATARESQPKLDPVTGLRGSAAGSASLTQAVVGAIRAKDEALLEVALRVARRTKTDIDPGTLSTGLQIEVSRFREAICWHIALIDPERLPSYVKEKVASSAADDTASFFACEVAARILGRPVREMGDSMTKLGEEGAKRAPIASVVLMHLTPGERRALSQARTGNADQLDRHLERTSEEARPPRERSEHGPAEEASGRLLDLTGFPRGFVPDVLAATRCGHAPPEKWAAAEMIYGEDGRPRAMSPLAGLEGLEKCQRAARLLLRSSLAPDHGTSDPGSKHVVLARLDRDFVECSASATTGESGREEWPRSVGGQIREPKKIRNVNPVYPESAKKERRQGVVILEAVIGTSGCITSLEVIRSVHPALNAAAMRAASDWRYTPTLLDGQPVPVIMTITVNFRLSY